VPEDVTTTENTEYTETLILSNEQPEQTRTVF